ncbi:LLM class flavin-dependent oxidoreductase [Streptomyces harbinensis]|uniref:LLM class flavin-dependent oxidoreductase n=1 Tax=Streptomyces harbinensis TaxID=1176198 RepID=UPI003391EA6C
MIPAPEVRLGVLLTTNRHGQQSDAEVFARALAIAERAEESGIDDLWVTEHHFSEASISPSALALAAFLLGRTRRIRVGTAVTLLPLHSPVHVAEQAALLDQLSGGRFHLGVGRGMPLIDYEVIGGGGKYWHGGMGEDLELVLRAWQGEVSGRSELYSFPSVTTLPRPRERSGPPVHVAGGSAATISMAAERGLPLLLFFDKDAEAKAEMIALHRKHAVAAGHPASGYDHAFALFAHVTDDGDEAERLMRDRARHLVESAQLARFMTGAPRKPGSAAQRAAAIDSVAEGLLDTQPVGGVETCVDRIVHHILTSGAGRVLCQIESVGTAPGALRNLERLTTEVFPTVRERVSRAWPERDGRGSS